MAWESADIEANALHCLADYARADWAWRRRLEPTDPLELTPGPLSKLPPTPSHDNDPNRAT
jgi:hypothetical protein